MSARLRRQLLHKIAETRSRRSDGCGLLEDGGGASGAARRRVAGEGLMEAVERDRLIRIWVPELAILGALCGRTATRISLCVVMLARRATNDSCVLNPLVQQRCGPASGVVVGHALETRRCARRSACWTRRCAWTP